MPIIRTDFTIDTRAMCNRAQITDPDDLERFFALAGEAEARPGAAVYEVRTVDGVDGDDVTIGGVTFHARPLSRLFEPGMTVYPYVATCGVDMADYGNTLTDSLERYWWDLIMLDAVSRARGALLAEVKALAGHELISINPGSIELWPISNQPALFSLIGDVEKLIGVTINPSFLMLPLKSVSGIFFPGGGGFTHNCCLCTREGCPGRRAPYDPELKAQLEGEKIMA